MFFDGWSFSRYVVSDTPLLYQVYEAVNSAEHGPCLVNADGATTVNNPYRCVL